jgi:hypothetical protein
MENNFMDEKQLKEMARFEEENDCTVISPNLMQQIKPKQQFFYVAWQDDSGRIIDIKHYDDYDTALLKGMENAKVTGTTWTIRDLSGRFIDGNYIGK